MPKEHKKILKYNHGEKNLWKHHLLFMLTYNRQLS